MNGSRRDLPPSVRRSNASAQRSNRLFFGVVAALLVLMGVGVGFSLAQWSQPVNGAQTEGTVVQDRSTDRTGEEVDFDLFWEVWDRLQDDHVDQPVSDTDLFYGAMRGLVSGVGDPYSVFLPPADSDEFLGEINGSFEGIGAEIGIKNDQLTIVSPLSGSPAEQAGLRASDVIVAIDGVDSSFMTLNAAVSRIRGEGGTDVVLTVRRREEAPFDVVVTRGTIQIESVRYEVRESGGKRIGVIEITHFNGDTTTAFQEVVQEIALDTPDSLVVDLRNNAGGFLDASIAIASAFLEEGAVVVYEEDSEQQRSPFTATGAAPLGGVEVVVLINGGSASASEILAGALADHGVGAVIGSTSFGKGTVQDLQQLDDGSSLKVTVARWLTPDQNQINEVGITPDFEVELTPEDYDNDRDPQIEAALLYLTDREAFTERFTTEESIEENE